MILANSRDQVVIHLYLSNVSPRQLRVYSHEKYDRLIVVILLQSCGDHGGCRRALRQEDGEQT